MKRLIFLLIIVAGGVAAYYSMRQPAGPLVLTGIVTTEGVIVAPQLGGQIGQLMVKEGDQVERNQLIAVMTTDELQADRAYYDRTVESMQSQVGENEAARGGLLFLHRPHDQAIAQGLELHLGKTSI